MRWGENNGEYDDECNRALWPCQTKQKERDRKEYTNIIIKICEFKSKRK